MLAPEVLEPVRLTVAALLDKKAFQVVCLELSELASFADAFVLCSAASDRQVGALVDEVQRRLREGGRRPLHVEGEGSTGWVLLDYGDFIVHVFTEERRSYYALDSLWGDAPRLDPEELGVTARGPEGRA
ncbi:MAG TPA: ribosome silencing factor [Thermoanaerobaculales bacterium]|nr:ribosome silencing factor [Thermoanaerobaculales bacterium]HPA79251.1 ribosome silencing factor [Thermoanaerobaculales bacterium]HQL29101.1 ribosome silencing factor [Thermoanaerobaculales bacterium]HQN96753.1 ribosome silencing factor [Thermoanaerobaculales bacterium]HQP42605.1 ribosome silencing factor [Thermoanaerobaculales bacterium]